MISIRARIGDSELSRQFQVWQAVSNISSLRERRLAFRHCIYSIANYFWQFIYAGRFYITALINQIYLLLLNRTIHGTEQHQLQRSISGAIAQQSDRVHVLSLYPNAGEGLSVVWLWLVIDMLKYRNYKYPMTGRNSIHILSS